MGEWCMDQTVANIAEIIRSNPRALLYATVVIIFACAMGALLVMFTLTLLFGSSTEESAFLVPGYAAMTGDLI
jgi:hypothetical protein